MNTPTHSDVSPPLQPGGLARFTAVIAGLFGLINLVGGIWLLTLGGSPYYLVVGVLLLVNAALFWQASRRAYALYALIVLGTVIWAVWEAGLDFWRLAPRLDVIVLFGVWLVLPWISRSFAKRRAPARAPLVGSLVIAVLVLLATPFSHFKDIEGTLPGTSGSTNTQSDASDVPEDEWHAYARTSFGNHFSPLKQINTQNVQQLKVAWTFRTGDLPTANDPGEVTNEATPLKIGHVVYTCTAHQRVFALDAASGKQLWTFDPHLQNDKSFQHITCRGLSYHTTAADARTSDGQPAPAECSQRLFLPTNDGRLIALDAKTGQTCRAFGQNGQVDLKEGMEVKRLGFLEGTSPPVVTRNLVIMAGSVIDNYSTHEPSGVIRAYDVYTGKLVWAWDAGAVDENAMPSADHQFTANSPNAWTVMSADEKLGLVYVPLGGGAPDIWGGHRSPQQEKFGSALVALDIATGKRVWYYQTVHHDLWDMDIPSQPALVDLKTANGIVPAVYVPTKTGNLFVLNRKTGELIVPAPETPVPQEGAAKGDHLSPTQPFSQLSFQPRDRLTDKNMWGATMFDQLVCRIMFKQLKYDGPFTPPSEQGTLVFPGDFGMFEWGGIAIDPARQVAFANPMGMPFVSKLIPRGPNNPAEPNNEHPAGSEFGVQPMYGTPYGVQLNAFLSPLKFPCPEPPWGYVAGIDLRTNTIAWQHKVGTTRDATPLPLPFKLGMPMLGGPLITAGGLGFLTGTMDNYIRAFDITNGKTLWEGRLPAGGQSTPMSYSEGGHQYILTVAGGHGSFGTKMGDYIIAYRLPD